MTPPNLYKVTPHSGDCGTQYVVGYREAMDVARSIAKRGHDVTVRNERGMFTWIVVPAGSER
jgi:hypothetical protein